MERTSRCRTALLGVLVMLAVLFLVRPVTAHAELARPTIGSVVTASQKVKLKWSKVSGANGYYIYSVTENGGLKKVASTSKRTAVSKTISGLKNGKEYTFCVVAYKGGETSEPSAYISATPNLPGLQKVTGFYVSQNFSKKVMLRWNKVSGASGYMIYMENEDGEYKPIAKTTGGTYLVKNLKNGREYHFRVCSYRKKNSKIYPGVLSDTVIGRPVSDDDLDDIHSYYYKARMKDSYSKGGVKIPKGATVTVLSKGAKTSKVVYDMEETTVPNGKLDIFSIITNYKEHYDRETAENFVNRKGYTSGTRYMIWISSYTQYLYVFEGSQYNWTLKFMTICATGKLKFDMDVKDHKKGDPCETPIGISRIWGKKPVWEFQADQVAYYASSCAGGAIHSWLYYPDTRTKWNIGVGSYGTPSSHGCVRIEIDKAEWIYNNCDNGTTVVVF